MAPEKIFVMRAVASAIPSIIPMEKAPVPSIVTRNAGGAMNHL
jgi:hypothetical protein